MADRLGNKKENHMLFKKSVKMIVFTRLIAM